MFPIFNSTGSDCNQSPSCEFFLFSLTTDASFINFNRRCERYAVLVLSSPEWIDANWSLEGISKPSTRIVRLQGKYDSKKCIFISFFQQTWTTTKTIPPPSLLSHPSCPRCDSSKDAEDVLWRWDLTEIRSCCPKTDYHEWYVDQQFSQAIVI